MKTVVKDVGLSFGFPRIAYPGPGTTYYYSFHLHYVVAPTATSKGYSTLPPKTKSWIGSDIPSHSAYSDWLAYGHQAPGVVQHGVRRADPALRARGLHLGPAAGGDLPARPRRA